MCHTHTHARTHARTHTHTHTHTSKAAFITTPPFAAGISCKRTQGHKQWSLSIVMVTFWRYTWLRDHKYFSPDILNEQIELMGHSVLRSILKELRIRRNEQMCLCVWWADEEYSVNEDTIGLVHVSKTDSNTLFTELKAALICCMLPLDKCRGQAYDGAANMSGKHHGNILQRKIEWIC